MSSSFTKSTTKQSGGQAVEEPTLPSPAEWGRMGQSELEAYARAHLSPENQPLRQRWPELYVWIDGAIMVIRRGVGLVSLVVFKAIHWSARAAGQPLVDLGQSYSPTELQQRVAQLEILLLNQWTNLKADDFSTADDEIKQFLAACHVARQYDRITVEMMAKRLGVSAAKSNSLINQMQQNDVLTEPYTETFYDIRKSSIDEVISRHVADLRKIAPNQIPNSKKKQVN